MIRDDEVEGTEDGSGEDDKIADDDASLAVAAPRRSLRLGAVIGAVATLLVAGGGLAAYINRPSRSPIAEEPKGPTVARSPSVPSFLAAAPATPTPAPVKA